MLFGNLKGINEEENVVELKVELGIELLRLGSLKGIRELMVKVELIVGLISGNSHVTRGPGTVVLVPKHVKNDSMKYM